MKGEEEEEECIRLDGLFREEVAKTAYFLPPSPPDRPTYLCLLSIDHRRRRPPPAAASNRGPRGERPRLGGARLPSSERESEHAMRKEGRRCCPPPLGPRFCRSGGGGVCHASLEQGEGGESGEQENFAEICAAPASADAHTRWVRTSGSGRRKNRPWHFDFKT